MRDPDGSALTSARRARTGHGATATTGPGGPSC